MTRRAPMPIFADERTAAGLLTLKVSEFKSAVDRGDLPRPCNVAGHDRWRVEDLERIATGQAMLDDVDQVEWDAR